MKSSARDWWEAALDLLREQGQLAGLPGKTKWQFQGLCSMQRGKCVSKSHDHSEVDS